MPVIARLQRLDRRRKDQFDILLIEHFEYGVLQQRVLDDKTELRHPEFRRIEMQRVAAFCRRRLVPHSHAIVRANPCLTHSRPCADAVQERRRAAGDR